MKKSIISFGLLFVFSLTMLIGTSYAWFSETITVTDNRISSGGFDIDMLVADYHKIGEAYPGSTFVPDWKSLDPNNTDESARRIFNSDNVYPGYYESKLLKIKNTGELDAAINITGLLRGIDGTTDPDLALVNDLRFTVWVNDNETPVYDNTLDVNTLHFDTAVNYVKFADFFSDYYVLRPNEVVVLKVRIYVRTTLGGDPFTVPIGDESDDLGENLDMNFDISLLAVQPLQLTDKGIPFVYFYE